MQPDDLPVANDVLAITFANEGMADLLTYENIPTLIQVATNLINSKFETHILTGLHTIHNVLKEFNEPMIKVSTGKVVLTGDALDLEETKEKVNACIKAFALFNECKGF